MKPVAALAGLALLAGVVLGPTAAVSAEPASDVTVTWPELTAFNPTTTTYDFDVDGGEAGHVFYTWGYTWQADWEMTGEQVPDGGHVSLDLTDRGSTGIVRVWTCTETAWVPGQCHQVDASPELRAYSAIQVVNASGSDSMQAGLGLNHLSIQWLPRPQEDVVPTGTWELLSASKQPLPTPVTGTIPVATLASDPNGFASIGFSLPTTLHGGTYYLDLHLAADYPEFGHLEGSLGSDGTGLLRVDVDAVKPTIKVPSYDPVFYPERDGYRDSFQVPMTLSSDAWAGDVEVSDARGQRVFQQSWSRVYDVAWNGRRNGAVVPEGRYSVRLSVSDFVGNTSVWRGSVVVSHDQLRWATYRRTVTAAASLTGKPHVGSCSTLDRHPRHSPSGSLGLYSQSRCVGAEDANGVATTHGAYVPAAFGGQYKSAELVVNGGPATRSRLNYLATGFLTPPRGKLDDLHVFRGAGKHVVRMSLQYGGVYGRKTDRPYVVWANGLNSGSRYVVRSYTLQVRYRVLD